MPICGTFLPYFAEFFKRRNFYILNPKVGGGYEAREFIGTYPCYMKEDNGDGLERETGLVREFDMEWLYTYSTDPIEPGLVVEKTPGGYLYKLKKSREYDDEGGFRIWLAEYITGGDDIPKSHMTLTQGRY